MKPTIRFLCRAALLLPLSLPLPALAGSFTLEVIAATGDVAPGAPPGSTFQALFEAPVLNAAGEVAFVSLVPSPSGGVNSPRGIWTDDGAGGLELVMLEDTPAPGQPGVHWYLGPNPTPRLNDAGQVSFEGRLAGPDYTGPSLGAGFWRSDGAGGFDHVIHSGDAVPWSVPVTFIGLDSQAELAADGSMAFTGFVDASAGSGLWTVDPAGALALVAEQGTPAPGTASAFSVLGPIALSDAGELVFGGLLDPVGQGLWLSNGVGAPTLLHAYGDQAPGAPTGDTLIPFGGLRINAAGGIAFAAALEGPVPSSSAVFGPDGTSRFTLLVAPGDAAPGTAPGTTFSSLQDVVLNEAGQTAFYGQLAGATAADDEGFWLYDDASDSILLRVREGGAAPELPGAVLETLFLGSHLNGLGDFLFAATLSGAGIVDGVNDAGIFVVEADGTQRLVLQHGDLVEFSPGDFQTVQWFDILDGTDASPAGRRIFNDAGQLVFTVFGESGDYAVVRATIPEPGTALLVGLGLVMLRAQTMRMSGTRARSSSEA